MKRLVFLLWSLLLCVSYTFAQADKICGLYELGEKKTTSKVRIYKLTNGKYRAQVAWAMYNKNDDGSVRYDEKNPDKAKRNVPFDQIVVVQSLTYHEDSKKWSDGKIYDPETGRKYTVEFWFQDDKTLVCKGSIGPFSHKLYWRKIK